MPSAQAAGPNELSTLYTGCQSMAGGMDSYSLPLNLADNKYVSSENTINRGGIVQTRPDSKSLLTCPCGSAQGCVLFTPANGIPYLVFASYGSVYVSPKPFNSYTKLENISFNPQSKFISWAVCSQSTDYDPAGNQVFLPTPTPILIMQDGSTRAAAWDGTTNRHLNPTFSGTPNATVPGYDETRIGLWMVWSNNRLWVSRGNQIFASDIGNPLKFTEAQFLAETRAFYLDDQCTGMCETPDRQGIICFTKSDGVFIKSSVQDRTQWLSLADGVMYSIFLPNTGCVAHRSIVNQYGLLWWFSMKGLMNMNAAQRQNLSSTLEIRDTEMSDSKYFMGSTLERVCGASVENFLMQSVPSGDKYNRHTWVLDQNPLGVPSQDIYVSSYSNSWVGRWTGWRPVEWTTGIVDGVNRAFFQSIDYDGNVRIWEAFTGRTGCDNGVPITAWMKSKDYNFSTLERKRFRWAEFALTELIGTPSISVAYAGRRGSYTTIFNGELCASVGEVYYASTYGDGTRYPLLSGNRVQTRRFRTQDSIAPTGCNSCVVESNDPNNADTQFSLLFMWSGKLGLEWFKLVSTDDQLQEGGDAGCVVETCPRSLSEQGCGSQDDFVSGGQFTTFTSTKTYSVEYGPYTYSATETATSLISQANADALALAMAVASVNYQAGFIT